MTQTGAADLIGDKLVALVSANPRVLLAGLFFITACLTQLIANASAALIMFPIALATAAELHINPQPAHGRGSWCPCRIHDPGRDPAKSNDLWTRRISIRGFLEAGYTMRGVVRRGRGPRRIAGLEILRQPLKENDHEQSSSVRFRWDSHRG